MNEREALLRAVCENPDDDTPRLVFADWLQENGDEHDQARAEFIRAQVRSAARFESGDRTEDDPDALFASQLESLHGSRWWLSAPPAREGVSFRMWRGFPFRVVAPNRRALSRAEHAARIARS
ncbi:MAG: TIGR02996 domain-containing protein [Gemmataceae bacterium]|nr:TIGR02996 domain-containing protein [Gemmataceae bacterium]